MKTSEQINELAKALSEAQGEISNPEKNAKNPHFKSDYADLAGVLATVRPAFSKVGLSVVQMPFVSETGGIGVCTRIMHESGQWVESELSIPLQGNNLAQAAGTVITYLRRYCLTAAAGIHQADPDAQDLTGEVTPLRGDRKALADEHQDWIEGMKKLLHTEGQECMAVELWYAQPQEIRDELHNGAPKNAQGNWGPFESKDKQRLKECQTIFDRQCQDVADAILATEDDSEIQEILAELEGAHEKATVWRKLTPVKQGLIKRMKAA